MTLQFESLSIQNFGPFRRVENLDLSTRTDAPVVLIHGENTLGKTQLFSALRWCLYGGLTPQQTPAKALPLLEKRLNNPARRDGETTMEVVLKFRVGTELYVLTRTAHLGGTAHYVTKDLRIGPTVIPQGSIDIEIGKQLHPQISEFFLFDAELMQRFYDRLNTDRERAFIRESIETVLGIPALQLAENDVADLAQDATRRQASAARSVTEASKIESRLERLDDEQNASVKDKAELHLTLAKAEKELKEVNDQLRVTEGLQADIHDQEMLEAQIASGDLAELKLREEMRQLLSDGWRAPLQLKLRGALARVEERNNTALSQQKAISRTRTKVEVLRERLAGGNCVACGQSLPEPEESTQADFEAATAELERLERETGGGEPDMGLERKINGLLDRTTGARYADKSAQLAEILGNQYLRRRSIEQIKDRLEGNDLATIRVLGQRQTTLQDVVESTKRRFATLNLRISSNSVERKKLEKQLDRLPGASPTVVLEANFYSYTKDLLTRTIEHYRERTRSDVEQGASAMFDRLVRDPAGYGGLRISPDFRVELLDNHSNPRETSEGGKQLVALSLIGALKGAAVRGGPVVLDSPLARLDLDHREKVLQQWIPSLGSQAILLVQSGELTIEDGRKIVGSRLGHEYRLSRPNNNPEEAVIERTS